MFGYGFGEIVFWAAILGVIPAIIADRKGHSFIVWWFLGAALFIIALPMALLLKPDAEALAESGEAKKCPKCAELVKPEAQVCRFCNYKFPVAAAPRATNPYKNCPSCGETLMKEAVRCRYCQHDFRGRIRAVR